MGGDGGCNACKGLRLTGGGRGGGQAALGWGSNVGVQTLLHLANFTAWTGSHGAVLGAALSRPALHMQLLKLEQGRCRPSRPTAVNCRHLAPPPTRYAAQADQRHERRLDRAHAAATNCHEVRPVLPCERHHRLGHACGRGARQQEAHAHAVHMSNGGCRLAR